MSKECGPGDPLSCALPANQCHSGAAESGSDDSTAGDSQAASEPRRKVATDPRARDQERTNRNAGHDFYDLHDRIFWIGRSVREILQRDEVTKMFDTILSLAVCAALLVYLVYAMLRPEKF
jgi:K+-transporting ATPase KdpF subunit